MQSLLEKLIQSERFECLDIALTQRHQGHHALDDARVKHISRHTNPQINLRLHLRGQSALPNQRRLGIRGQVPASNVLQRAPRVASSNRSRTRSRRVQIKYPAASSGEYDPQRLKRLYNLSDVQMEYQLLDRHSYQRFGGLLDAARLPDRTTIWHLEKCPDFLRLTFFRKAGFSICPQRVPASIPVAAQQNRL